MWIFVFLILGVQLYLLNHLQFVAWPEMISYAYLRNQGFLMYQDMIHPYPPLFTIGLSIVYNLFGHSLENLKIVSWTISLLSSVLVFLITKHLTRNNLFGLLALGFYALIQPFLEGNMLWFDNVIVLPVLSGVYASFIYFKDKKLKWLIIVALSFSLAALIKQTAALFLIIFFAFLIFNKTQPKKLLVFCLTPLVLLIPLFIRLLQEGSVKWFLEWTIIYPVTEWGKYPNYVQMAVNDRDMLTLQILLVPPFVFAMFKRSILKDRNFFLLVLFLLISLIAVYPRFSFFHFQSALAFTIILWVFSSSRLNLKTTVVSIVASLVFFMPVVFKPYIVGGWNKEARFMSQSDIKLATTINSIAKGERVFLQGLNSNLYAMSHTVPPKPWTDNFGWYLETPGIQSEILKRWENDPPRYIFWRHSIPGNWFDLGTYEPKEFVEYYKLHYNLKGEIEQDIEIWQRKD